MREKRRLLTFALACVLFGPSSGIASSIADGVPQKKTLAEVDAAGLKKIGSSGFSVGRFIPFVILKGPFYALFHP